MKIRHVVMGLTGLALLCSQPAMAALTCSVTAVGVIFPNYNGLSSSSSYTYGSGSVTVSCLNLLFATPITVAMTKGSASSYNPRTMTFGSYALNYNLYLDSGYTQIWGDGTGGSVTKSDTIGGLLGSSLTYTVYGRLPGGQNVAAGAYIDTIFVTVMY
ncbi:MAG: SCPU domain-containing protein [Cupriavidus sp.]|nr:MAG: SCPU domain-containing protein [Cupriavidus sp.]